MRQYLKKNKSLIIAILTLALPAIIEMSLNTLVGVADTIMISKFIGPEALSGAGYANQVIFTLIFIFSSFNVGATAMISRSYGEKNYKKLNNVMGQNITLNILMGIVITVFCLLFGSNILGIFDTTNEVFNLGLSYFNIVAFSQFFMFISFAAAGSMRGYSNTKGPMIITAIVNVINIIGNYFLITGFSVFPEMGIEGAALSTTISRVIGAVIYLVVLFKGQNRIKLKISNLKLSGLILKPLWKLSSAAGLEQLLMQTSFLVLAIIVSVLDTTQEATFRVLLSIESMSFMPAVGFSIATASLVGKALGEKDIHKAKHTGHISLAFGIAWGVFIGLIFAIFPSFILGIFSDEVNIINNSTLALTIVGIDQPFFAFVLILSGVLRGAGDTKSVLIITSLRQWFCFVPLTYILIMFFGIGVESIWLSEAVSLLVFNTVMIKRFRGGKWTKIQV